MFEFLKSWRAQETGYDGLIQRLIGALENARPIVERESIAEMVNEGQIAWLVLNQMDAVLAEARDKTTVIP